MAHRVLLTPSLSLPLPSQPSPTEMAAFGGAAAAVSARIIPSATRASLSLSSSSSSFGSRSSLECLRSSPRISPMFLNQRRGAEVRVSSRGYGTVSAPKSFASDPDQLKNAREDIKELLRTKFCHPLMRAFELAFFLQSVGLKQVQSWPSRYFYIPTRSVKNTMKR